MWKEEEEAKQAEAKAELARKALEAAKEGGASDVA